MSKKLGVGLALLFMILGVVFATSCAKKTIKSEPGIATTEEGAGTQVVGEGNVLEEQRLEEERVREEAKARRVRAERKEFLNDHIYFDYDKSNLDATAKGNLKSKASWLVAHPNVTVVIEGHCDERGTNEYNMALGDRRAQSARNYLVDLGIKRHRLTTISYGEEKPLAMGSDERSWANNRRDQFVIE